MRRSHFQISAAHSELKRITGMVEAFCGANKLPEATSNLMNLVLDEVLSNIIKYAYEAPEREIIDVQLMYSNNKLTASIEDRGVAFNPLGLQTAVASGPLQSRREGGLGIFFVKSLLDSVVYERIGDRNKVTLVIEAPSE
jgi:anti-sigma regulatory factor (Ser/Thr protein kinase)